MTPGQATGQWRHAALYTRLSCTSSWRHCWPRVQPYVSTTRCAARGLSVPYTSTRTRSTTIPRYI